MINEGDVFRDMDPRSGDRYGVIVLVSKLRAKLKWNSGRFSWVNRSRLRDEKSYKPITLHLQKNGSPNLSACGKKRSTRTWNIANINCEECKKTEQCTDAIAFCDIGSPGGEI